MTEQLSAIGEAAEATGVKVETIRYYERVGLMPPPRRTEGGHRAYDGGQVRRLGFIRRGRELGFGLGQIRQMLRLADDGSLTCGEIHAMTQGHLASVREKIADLRRLEAALSDISADCSGGDAPACPIVERLYEGSAAASRPRPAED